MSAWLNADQVADRLGVARRTALILMQRMPHTVISGKERKRIRVSENQLEAWLIKNSTGKQVKTGNKKRLTEGRCKDG